MNLVSNSIIVLASPRTGSNWLIRALQSAPEAACYGELCKSDFYTLDRGAARVCLELGIDIELARQLHNQDRLEIVRRLFRRSEERGKRFCFKLFYSHSAGHSLLQSSPLSDSSTVVHLVRDKIFDSFTSLELAKRSGIWLKGGYGDTTMIFNEADYLEYRQFQIDNYVSWSKRLLAAKCISDVIRVEYSEIGEKDLLDKLTERLGFSSRLTMPDLEKQSSRPSIEYWSGSEASHYMNDRLADFM